MRDRLLVVSAVHDEARHLDRTARAMAAQHRPPDRWVVVDDASADDTLEIARRWERSLPWLTVLQAPARPASGDGLALAREARAFNAGLDHAGWRDFTHVGKLDGDIELPPDWYATLLARFSSEPRLGLAGGRLEEPGVHGWCLIPIPGHHVHGAVKLYSAACLEAIGGIEERLGWDTIDETYARMRGHETRSLPDLVARHHRPWGSASGRLRGKARHGETAWLLHQPASWAALRALKHARAAPAGLSGAAFAYGYLHAAVRRPPRIEDPEYRRYVRGELRERVAGPLRAGLARPGSTTARRAA